MTLAAGTITPIKSGIPRYVKRGGPLLGVLPELSRDPLGFLDRLVANHGSMAPIKVGPHRIVVAGHPDALRQVCVLNADNYEKTRFVEKLKPIIGNGLATSNGPVWQASRNVIQPALALNELKDMIVTMDGVIRRTVAGWPEEPFDIAHECCALTLKVVTATLFGKTDDTAARMVVEGIDAIQDYISKYIWDVLPWRQAVKAPSYRRFEQAMDKVRAIVRSLIDERRTEGRKNDLLQALIDAVDPETGEKFSEQQILDEVITLYMAGHDTTGNTLAFTLSHLAEDPELQEMVREEALRCIPLDRAPTFEEISRMTLTTSILKEVMRLYPSSWWFARTAIEDDDLLGVPVAKGDVVMVAPYVTHRLAEYWDEPDTFDPFRFLRAKPTHKFAYLPFSAGPRMCPGSHLATMEIMLSVARLVQRSELHKQQDLEVEALVTLRPKNGLMMSVKPWTEVITVGASEPGQHALIDTLLRMRKRVFVDALGWTLNVDEEGREVDQFDNADSDYSAMISEGHIKSFGRLRSTDKPSLLFDVYGDLIEMNDSIKRGADVWEGTRLGVSPDVPSSQRAYWLRQLLMNTVDRMRMRGITCLCSVSTAGMEQVLRRAGLSVRRLGYDRADAQGQAVSALRIDLE